MLMKSGPLGLIVAALLFDNFKMKSKLFSIIENNTQAMTKLIETIKEKK